MSPPLFTPTFIPIFVKLPKGDSKTPTVAREEPFGDLKMKIPEKGGLPIVLQHLQYQGRPMKDANTVGEYNLLKSTNVIVLVQLLGDMLSA